MNEGRQAYLSGLKPEDCPYPSSHSLENFSQDRYDWLMGYYDAWFQDKYGTDFEEN